MMLAALVIVGLIAGALASTLGVGGGIVFVPALVIIAGFEQQLAEGTSLAVILPTMMVGAWSHHRLRGSDCAYGRTCCPNSSAGKHTVAPAGSRCGDIR